LGHKPQTGWENHIMACMALTHQYLYRVYPSPVKNFRRKTYPTQPVHFLANSIIGPSFYIHMPNNITYTPIPQANTTTNTVITYGYSYYNGGQQQTYDSACWAAFRAGSYALPQNLEMLDVRYNVYQLGNSTTYKLVNVQYTPACTPYLNNTDIKTALGEYNHTITYWSYVAYRIGDCNLGNNVVCKIQGMSDFCFYFASFLKHLLRKLL
jgi:hypothetical protein